MRLKSLWPVGAPWLVRLGSFCWEHRYLGSICRASVMVGVCCAGCGEDSKRRPVLFDREIDPLRPARNLIPNGAAETLL